MREREWDCKSIECIYSSFSLTYSHSCEREGRRFQNDFLSFTALLPPSLGHFERERESKSEFFTLQNSRLVNFNFQLFFCALTTLFLSDFHSHSLSLFLLPPLSHRAARHFTLSEFLISSLSSLPPPLSLSLPPLSLLFIYASVRDKCFLFIIFLFLLLFLLLLFLSLFWWALLVRAPSSGNCLATLSVPKERERESRDAKRWQGKASEMFCKIIEMVRPKKS